MVWMIFTKILKNTIQRSNKKVNLIVTSNLFESKIPVTTGGFELSSQLGTDFVSKRFAVQTLLWSLEFIIQTNLEHGTIAITQKYF